MSRSQSRSQSFCVTAATSFDQQFAVSSSPEPWATTVLVSPSMSLRTLGSTHCISDLAQVLSFWDWLISRPITSSRLIHVVTYGRILLRLNDDPLHVCVGGAGVYTHTHTHVVFTHSSVGGHLARFHILVLVSDHEGAGIPLKSLISVLLDTHPEVGLLDHRVSLFFMSLGNPVFFHSHCAFFHFPL